jgi:hypothetical protein
MFKHLDRFLLAQLHLNSLVDKTTPNDIAAALKTLPKGEGALAQAYGDISKRIGIDATSEEPTHNHPPSTAGITGTRSSESSRDFRSSAPTQKVANDSTIPTSVVAEGTVREPATR